MMQSLHILRKDIRHLWPDLSIYVALLIAASITIPMGWDEAAAWNAPLRTFIVLLQILIPILWLVLIARLIHDEALVGDTQFWITRPYKWISLLSAKLLFLALCLVLPFVVTQWALLLQAGFNPIHTIAGQSLSLFQNALWVWLPFTTVAAVTSTLQRMFMSMLAAVLLWIVVLTIVGSSGSQMSLPFAAETMAMVMTALLLGILFYQYVTRNTFASRTALVATVLLFVALFFAAAEIQSPVNDFVRHHYPVSANTPLHLTFDSSVHPTLNGVETEIHSGKFVGILLPIKLEGLDPSERLDGENVSFTLDAPGYHYTSPWRPIYRDQYDHLEFFLTIPQTLLDKVHALNLHVHFSLIATRLLPGTPQVVTVSDHFSVPEQGTCRLERYRYGSNLSCRFPFQISSPATIAGSVTSAPCGNSAPVHPGVEALSARSTFTGLAPIVRQPLHLGGAVCPGTQLTFTPYHPAENFRLELDIPSISLDQYHAH
jgi:hypothetical protein